jgi:hypothetical protein
VTCSEEELDYYANRYLKWKYTFEGYLNVVTITTFKEFLERSIARKLRKRGAK